MLHEVRKRDMPEEEKPVIAFDRFGHALAPVCWIAVWGWVEHETLNPIPDGHIVAWMDTPASELWETLEPTDAEDLT